MQKGAAATIADALVDAVAFIELRPPEDLSADADVRALESIAHILGSAGDQELDELAAAASRAASATHDPERLAFLQSFMEALFEGWKGNRRV